MKISFTKAELVSFLRQYIHESITDVEIRSENSYVQRVRDFTHCPEITETSYPSGMKLAVIKAIRELSRDPFGVMGLAEANAASEDWPNWVRKQSL